MADLRPSLVAAVSMLRRVFANDLRNARRIMDALPDDDSSVDPDDLLDRARNHLEAYNDDEDGDDERLARL